MRVQGLISLDYDHEALGQSQVLGDWIDSMGKDGDSMFIGIIGNGLQLTA